MKSLSLSGVFANLFKGETGEAEVLTSISKLLKNKSGEENYYLIPKATLSDINGSVEIDLLLLHPVLGVYVIEVKNWSSMDVYSERKSPYEQANRYQDMVLALLQKEFGRVPINVEFRVIFPSISKEEGEQFFQNHPYEKHFINHTFFKEHMEQKDKFERFFNATVVNSPNKKQFLKISSLLVPTKTLKANKNRIIPVITKDEIIFFDQKQLSIMNGYRGDFRIIRGVAGTGKTIILTNFVAQRLSIDENETFLILCFNKKLGNEIKESFGDKYNKRQIAIYSIMALLLRIGFDKAKVGIQDNDSLDRQYELFESDVALVEFREKFRKHLKAHPIDYVLCDETQDMPAGFMRIIYEEIRDCIFFIDEAQMFFGYTMENIASIFHHPKFEKKSMSGRVKNLKYVYRTPSNIAHCAFKLLSFDTSLNRYYKKSYYLQNSFLEDISCVLEDGSLVLGDYDSFENLEKLLVTMPNDETTVVLTHTRRSVAYIEDILQKLQNKNIKVMTMQSIKGLEAQNVIMHNFGWFLNTVIQNEKSIVYRKVYVLLTRAKEKLYISTTNITSNSQEIQNIIKTLQEYEKLPTKDEAIVDKKEKSAKLKLAKIRPVLHDVKDGTELVVAASELFAIIGGLFAL